MIYLDNNATTMVAPEVKEAMAPFFSDEYGNPSSLHGLGTKARRVLEEVRAQVARRLGAKHEREIIFTSGGTESNQTAIRSALRIHPDRKKVVITQVEHSSIRNFCLSLEQEGYQVVYVGVSRTGELDWDVFKSALTKDVALVSVMWANNETGVLFPVAEIAREVKKRGLALHVDAVQAVGKIKMNLSEISIDSLSFSAHKFHGPKGVGGLYLREGSPFFPLFLGGRQERDRRSGTENVSGIIGLARALTLALDALREEMPRVETLRDRLEHELLSRIPESFVNGAENLRIPNTTNITIPGVESEALLIRLSEAGIAASSGSACLTGALEPSHVLMAMGLPEPLALSSLRFSLSRFTTLEEIDEAVRIVSSLVEELRELNRAER